MTGESSPGAADVDAEAKSESDGIGLSLKDRGSKFLGRSASKTNLYIGSGLVALSLLLIAGGMASYAYGLQLLPGTDRYWLAIEAAFGAAAAGLPFLLTGVIVLFATSKRLRLGAGIGTAGCLSSVGLFVLAFPGNWQLSIRSPTFWVSGLYGLGLVHSSLAKTHTSVA